MVKLRRILLVEDNPHDAELTLEALAEHHLANDVDRVKDGEEALDYLYRRGPYANRGNGSLAVILLDLKLPKVDGLEVLRIIKSDENLKFTPVVVLTSSREERDMIESYRLGVNAYVVKPVNFCDFMNAVKELGAFWAIVNEPPPVICKKGLPE
jgi:CheY-like chemotaxis protein